MIILIFLALFNEELDPLAEGARQRLPETGSALDRICVLVRPWYGYFSANATLGRYAFREMTFYEPHSRELGAQCAPYRARMRRIETWMCEIIADARRRGELEFVEPAAMVGNLVYVIYLAEIRKDVPRIRPLSWWLLDDEVGVGELAGVDAGEHHLAAAVKADDRAAALSAMVRLSNGTLPLAWKSERKM